MNIYFYFIMEFCLTSPGIQLHIPAIKQQQHTVDLGVQSFSGSNSVSVPLAQMNIKDFSVTVIELNVSDAKGLQAEMKVLYMRVGSI